MKQALKMPFIFSDNMVLQRGRKIPIWGESNSDVIIVFKNKEYRAKSENGAFRVDLDISEKALGLTLKIKNSDCEIEYKNVAVGEVWLAGGQSNMEMMLRNTTNGMLDKQFEDFGDNIRYFAPPRKKVNSEELETKNNKSSWISVCDDDGSITAAGYYFAKRLFKKLGVPIGIIDCNCGSTSVFHWIPKSTALENDITNPYVISQDALISNTYDMDVQYKVMGASYTAGYGYFYENQLKNIFPYSLNGVIWYQGEADGAGESSANIYKIAFKMLLEAWRRGFEHEDLTFITVLLANYGGDWIGSSTGKSWAYLREAQINLAETENNLYFVSAADRGIENNIHPSEKKLVGERLAACALNTVYGLDIKWKCPTVKDVKIEKEKITIYLNNTYGRLYPDCGSSKDFEIKTFSKYREKYTAEIVDDHLEINTNNFPPIEICHAFENNPYIRIFNHYGLPLVPWRYKVEKL